MVPHQILLGSWNVAQRNKIQVDYTKWLNSSINHDNIDLYIFSFQEVTRVDNTSQSPEPIDTSCYTFWGESLFEFINSKRKESKIVPLWTGHLGGTLFISFAKKELVPQIEDVQHMLVEVGRSRTTIKGGVCLRFKLHKKTYSFVSCHLTADQEGDKFEQRVKDFHIISKSSFSNGALFGSHDFVFWLGDLNFRVNLPRDEIVKLVTQKKWREILQHDQLHKAQDEKLAFSDYTEGTINFPPTYKYKPGTEEFDLSEPLFKQIPAYTDRVLFKVNKKEEKAFHLQTYTLGHLCEADHKPIVAVFAFG